MKAKHRLLLVALVAILLTVLTQPTLAYYTAYGKATNVVTSGDIQLQIHEKTADGNDFPEEGVYVIPGDIVSKRVSIENVCGHPFYLRVKVVSNSTNQALSADDCLKLDINTADWTFVDGYYYYNKILQPGEVTPALFTQVEIVGSKVDQNHVGSMLSLTVNAYAVQSQNNPAEHPWNAAGWPAD
jgi:predicted ribosomally synthesized peptide with SipW-like signal peptide